MPCLRQVRHEFGVRELRAVIAGPLDDLRGPVRRPIPLCLRRDRVVFGAHDVGGRDRLPTDLGEGGLRRVSPERHRCARVGTHEVVHLP